MSVNFCQGCHIVVHDSYNAEVVGYDFEHFQRNILQGMQLHGYILYITAEHFGVITDV